MPPPAPERARNSIYQKPPSSANGRIHEIRNAPTGLPGRAKRYWTPAACRSSTSFGSPPVSKKVLNGSVSVDGCEASSAAVRLPGAAVTADGATGAAVVGAAVAAGVASFGAAGGFGFFISPTIAVWPISTDITWPAASFWRNSL